MGFILNTCTSLISKALPALCVILFCSFSGQQEIPKKFKKSDQNENGIIEIHEVNTAIDYLFIGSKGYTTKYIHELIDFYYGQKQG